MKTNPSVISATVPKWKGVKQLAKRISFLFVALFLLIAGSYIYWKYFYTYSEGYRAGLLQKFSHKGNIVKTYEGEMVLSSVSGSMNAVIASEKFYFSVTNRELASQLDTLQGLMVRVHYRQKNGALFWHGDSEYIVDSVKRILPH